MNRSENFIPTKEQLEKLAKVAKVQISPEIRGDKNNRYISEYHFLNSESGLFEVWKPHIDRNQIAMIIKGLTLEQKDIFYDKLLRLYVKIHKNALEKQFTLWVMLLDPSISCKFLCEVIV